GERSNIACLGLDGGPDWCAEAVSERPEQDEGMPERVHARTGKAQAPVAYYGSSVSASRRTMTDNGSCYRSRTFREACKLRQIFTRPLHVTRFFTRLS